MAAFSYTTNSNRTETRPRLTSKSPITVARYAHPGSV
jgi:hypothetical protein